MSLPETVYRYRAMNEYDLDALANNYLYFSKIDSFNDPFEMSGSMRLDIPWPSKDWRRFNKINSKYWHLPREEIQKLIVSGQMNHILQKQENAWKETHEEMFQKDRERLLCCCFSAVNNHPLMWGHYGNGLRGVALGFSVAALSDGLGYKHKDFLCQVQYPDDDAFPVADYSPYLFLREGTEDYEEASRDVFFARFCTKSHEWGYEKEYRILLDSTTSKKPYGDKALAEVIFGELISDDRKNLIKALLVGRDIKFKEAVRSKTHYKIEIRDLA